MSSGSAPSGTREKPPGTTQASVCESWRVRQAISSSALPTRSSSKTTRMVWSLAAAVVVAWVRLSGTLGWVPKARIVLIRRLPVASGASSLRMSCCTLGGPSG